MKKILPLVLVLFIFSCSGNDNELKQAVATEAPAQAMSEQAAPESSEPVAQQISMTVYKDPNCGCCSKWIDHLEASNIKIGKVDLDPDSLSSFKQEHGIAPQFQSCHTGQTLEGYVFEGHVPAKTIKRFLEEKPEGAIGLTVPAMPVGSPGMEVGDKFLPYKVLMLMESGDPQIYAEFNSYEEQF